MLNPRFVSFLTVGGAVIVLLASLLELTFERTMKDTLDDALRWRMEEKIDEVWWLLATQYSKSPENKDGPSIGLNFRAQYDRFVHQRNFPELEAQLAWVQRFRVSAQLLGGVMILVGSVSKREKA